MSENICPQAGYSHVALRMQHPDWSLCLYCAKAFSSSSSNHHEMAYIDLTGDDSFVDQLDRPPPSRHQSAPALSIPMHNRSQILQQALTVGNEHRDISAQATRKNTAPGTLFTLSIALYTAKYTVERNGGLLSKRYSKGYPKSVDKISEVPFDTPKKAFQSHTDLIKAIILLASKDKEIRAQDWEIIASASVAQPSSISRFPSQVYQTTSLLKLLQSINVKVAVPFKFSLTFLYAFRGEEDDDDLDMPEARMTSTRQHNVGKGKKVIASSKRKASASPSIKKEKVKKEKKEGARVKTEQVKEEESIWVETKLELPDIQENKSDQQMNIADDDDLSALFMSDEGEGGEEQIGDDPLGNEENDDEQEPAKNFVPFTMATRNVKRSG